ncbi:MAG: GAF domain-containing protein [Symploca sp. SIO2E6]|nr:GAF domain-containing protein [Symploca sp. SIO2E6]
MTTISLKRLIAKKAVWQMLQEVITALDTPISIQDVTGKWLVGEEIAHPDQQYPVQLNDEVIGWVIGTPKAASVASLLSYLSHQELGKKELAKETLEKYQEINLLYKVSEKISANLKLDEIAKLIIGEAHKILEANSCSVMILDDQTKELSIISYLKTKAPKLTLKLGQGIAGAVALSGKAEIINDVLSDPRYTPGPNPVSSLMCAPIKIKNRILGVINVSHKQPVQYTAADLKLLNALASQAAVAVENAVLHRNKLKEERIKSNLERYLSSQVVEAVLDAEGNSCLIPVKRNVSILFSDIRNFTTTCEELEPETIVRYLNEYFTHMVEVIFNHQGTVNKFVGDMILALFGAPYKMLDAETKAIATAIEMQRRLQRMPVSWIKENFKTGIGISAGKVVVGNIGSPRHMDYTAIGDEVNIASRLQSIAKGGQILVSRSVYDETKELFQFKEFGLVNVKGRRRPVEVFEVLY